MRQPMLVLLAMALAAEAPPTHRYVLDQARSGVAAKVAFFGLASKTAHFPKLSGAITLDPAHPENAELAVDIDARALTAPDPVTLGRLKGEKFFWIERYPTVRFAGRGLTLTGNRSGTVAGALTARGVTRPATLAITFADPIGRSDSPQPITLTGRTTIDRRAFGMTSYSMIVGRKVAITIRARLMPV